MRDSLKSLISVSHLTQKEFKEILEKYQVIAIVGLSKDTSKPSYEVANYLKQNGYTIIPINPTVEEILGEKSYQSLTSMPIEAQKKIEIVNIFRRSEDVPPIVNQAVYLKRRNGKPVVIWMQLGITNEIAAENARKAGMKVVEDKCIMVEHYRLEHA
jgi:predicted CoA-binding protein